ncbi:MAG TPA: serine hydrolase domain-containing protein [Polyangiaceae bacterium]|nr:serine hydrolase domain-containing protein [Polyangiaceae bacterium]
MIPTTGQEPADPARAGMDADQIARVLARFRRQQADGVFPGGQIAVRRRGVLAVDEAVGIARGWRSNEGMASVEFTPALRSCVFSAGKPLVAIAVARLEHLEKIDVERPVASYWPEFAAAGKGDITILDVLLHRSGLYLREIERDWRHYGDWDGVMARIAAAAPAFRRGTLAYQPLGFGWILGEVVRRISGKPIARFLEEEILAPAGLDDLRLGVSAEEIPSLARSYWVDPKPPSLGGEVMVGFEEAQNSVEQLTAILPGAGTVGTARALARFYAWLLDGAKGIEGRPMISDALLARYTTAQTRGTDRTVRVPMVLGRGFGLGWFWPHPFGWWRTRECFGHAGNFGTLAWADPTTGCAIAVVTNGNRAPMKLVRRFAPIGSGIRAACAARSRSLGRS